MSRLRALCKHVSFGLGLSLHALLMPLPQFYLVMKVEGKIAANGATPTQHRCLYWALEPERALQNVSDC
jgi:hypothetical protein